MKMKWTAMLASACVASMAMGTAHAAFPDRPLTIIVPTAPGGGNDAMSRILAKKMGQELGQSIVVENKPGANGAIACGYVARAKPDGYTILFGYWHACHQPCDTQGALQPGHGFCTHRRGRHVAGAHGGQ